MTPKYQFNLIPRALEKQDLCKRGRGAGPRVASKTFNTEGNRYFKARAEIY